MSPRVHAAGIPVYNTNPERSSKEASAKIQEAVALLADVTPWQAAHVRSRLRTIFLSETRGPEFIPLGSSYFYRFDYYESRSVEWLAADLIAAAVGARFAERNLIWRPEQRLRVQRVAFEAQMAFANRLPEPYPLVEDLTALWERVGWSPAEPGAGSQRSLEASNAPRWVQQLMRKWHRLLFSQ